MNTITDLPSAMQELAKCDTWQCLYDQGEVHEYEIDLWCPQHGTGRGETFWDAARMAFKDAERNRNP